MKILAIIISLSLISSLCYSQTRHFIGGIFFNANGMEVKGQNTIFWQDTNGTIWGGGGFSTGLNVKRYLNKTLYLNLELRYIQKGSVYEFTNQYATQSYETLRLNYTELPLSIGYKLSTNRTNYFLETGFAYAKLFSSKLNISELADRSGDLAIQDFRDYDFSWIASFKFPLNKYGKENILLGLRFSYSLFSIHDQYKLANMVYGIQIDYLFKNSLF